MHTYPNIPTYKAHTGQMVGIYPTRHDGTYCGPKGGPVTVRSMATGDVLRTFTQSAREVWDVIRGGLPVEHEAIKDEEIPPVMVNRDAVLPGILSKGVRA
jgi:hypothetical protein